MKDIREQRKPANRADVRLMFQTQFSPPIFLYMFAAT